MQPAQSRLGTEYPNRFSPYSRLPKVDVEHAGMTPHDLVPRGVCLVREEYISLFDLRHNIRVPLDLVMMEAFAVDHLTHLYKVR